MMRTRRTTPLGPVAAPGLVQQLTRESRPTSVHLFCGAGGCSEGFRRAGFEVVAGANHWQKAIDTHAANFPDAEHLCVDLDHYDMRRLPRARVLVGSPICTEGSPADGVRRPRRKATPDQLDLMEQGPVADAAWERTRATAYDILRAVEIWRYDAVVCENVPQFATAWPLFHWWLQGMKILGYRSQIISVSAAHIGDFEGNSPAAQWRDRLFIVFTREDMPAPDLEVRPLAWCTGCEEDVDAIQSWRNGRTIGRYRQQYDYRCPNRTCRHQIVEPYVRPAADVIDWSDLGTRIGDRAQARLPRLADNTLRKIKLGLAKHRVPAIVTINHGDESGRSFPAHAAPLPTRTVKIGDGLAVPPFLVPSGGSWNTDTVPLTIPMRTVLTRESDALLAPAPFVVECHGGGSTTRAIDHPVATITAGGNHHGLVIPYRKGGKAYPADTGPLYTVTTVESHSVVTGATAPPEQISIEDCHYRMLSPREHLRAQRFGDDYVVLGNGTEQTMQAGNAVPCNVAQWIASRLLEVL